LIFILNYEDIEVSNDNGQDSISKASFLALSNFVSFFWSRASGRREDFEIYLESCFNKNKITLTLLVTMSFEFVQT
jgi:hypothetical protein